MVPAVETINIADKRRGSMPEANVDLLNDIRTRYLTFIFAVTRNFTAAHIAADSILPSLNDQAYHSIHHA